MPRTWNFRDIPTAGKSCSRQTAQNASTLAWIQ